MNFGERIKQLRKEKHLTQKDLADFMGMNYNTVLRYEKNQVNKITYDTLVKFSQALGIELPELLDGVFDDKLKYFYQYVYNKPKDNSKHLINVYGSVPAGYNIEAIQNIKDKIYYNSPNIGKNQKASDKYIALEVKGDSMYPDFQEEDIVIVELNSEFNNGDVVVVYVNGYEATLKQIFKNNDGSITLVPRNPLYPKKKYGINDEPIRVLGTVKELRRKL